MRDIQVLARIRLNLSTVDQFLAIACGLADDNPSIKERAYGAAKEARSSALLIDHLRNLFSHQQSVEAQQEAEQHYQHQPQESTTIGGSSRRHPSDHHHHQNFRHNAQLFTYSNQLTLVRAAKCLVANVAKILYLTDSVVLRNAGAASEHGTGAQEQPLEVLERQQQEKPVNQAPALSDRLDNVANYSQLLRCFGELSSELVDLGHCIMFSSEHHHKHWPLADSAGHQPAADWSFPPADQQLHQATSGRRNSHHLDQPYDQLQQDPGYYGPHAPATIHSGPAGQMRPSASTTSMLRYASGYAPCGPFGTRSAPAEGAAGQLSNAAAATADWIEAAADNQLVAKVQDMQTLFQVNRLIIDRSILLLLSASKCCLRQGGECLRGLEARHSIVVQIRASVSIIMAIVKCSIFGETSAVAGSPRAAAELPAPPLGWSNQVSQQQRQQLAAWAGLGRPGASSANSVANINSQHWQRDNQFDNYYYLLCVSPPSRAHHQQSGLNSNNSNNAAAAVGSRLFDQHRYSPDQLLAQAQALQAQKPLAGVPFGHHQQQSAGAIGGQANKFHCATNLNLSPAANNGQHQEQQQRLGDAARPLEWPLQIMNYFLQTWNGTQSAHNAISKLQLLVRPFARLSHGQALIGTLNDTIEAFDRLQAQTADPSTQVIGPTTLETLDTTTNNKENQFPSQQVSPPPLVVNQTPPPLRQQPLGGPNMMLMNRRQLMAKLNSVFLGELKSNLIERAHEFTDCPYTRHEHRESIVLLIQCIKVQLNRLVKLLYRLRRKTPAGVNELHLGQLRQVAGQLDDTCAELKYELQTIVIEQSDELDKCNSKLDLIKQLKHHCLVGDLAKSGRCCAHFQEQAEQLVEVCKMLNQVAPTNKMKISTKTLAIWFELNMSQLLGVAESLAQNPRSRVLKDCAWAYLQVWCSFYDDFCQLARQLAYLTHAQYDANRALRVAALRDHMLAQSLAPNRATTASIYDSSGVSCSSHYTAASEAEEAAARRRMGLTGGGPRARAPQSELDDADGLGEDLDEDLDEVEELCGLGGRADGSIRGLQRAPSSGGHPASSMAHATSVQSLNTISDALSEAPTESPRSLDHYYGFGANYSRSAREAHHQRHPPVSDSPHGPMLALSRQSASPRLCYGGGGGGPKETVRHDYRNQQHRQLMAYSDRPVSGPVTFIDDLAPIYPSDPRQQQVRSAGHPQPAPMEPLDPSLAYQQRRHRHHHHHHHHRHYQQQQQHQQQFAPQEPPSYLPQPRATGEPADFQLPVAQRQVMAPVLAAQQQPLQVVDGNRPPLQAGASEDLTTVGEDGEQGNTTDQQSSTTEQDKWSDSDADAIVRGARETAQMALSMYQFTKGEGDLNTTQDLFTQAELFAEEANELYKEVRCFSYKVPAGEPKKELLAKLSAIPALVQQLQFIVKNPTVGKPATFAKVDSVIRETRNLMDAVNRVVQASLSCRQQYNMAIASMRKRTRTLSPSYRGDKGFEFESHSSGRQGGLGGRNGSGGGGGGMGSEPDI